MQPVFFMLHGHLVNLKTFCIFHVLDLGFKLLVNVDPSSRTLQVTGQHMLHGHLLNLYLDKGGIESIYLTKFM